LPNIFPPGQYLNHVFWITQQIEIVDDNGNLL